MKLKRKIKKGYLMKKLILVAVFLLAPVLGWAGDDKKEGFKPNACPKTTMQKDCLTCHVAGDFRVKETAPDAGLVYPNTSMKVIDGAGHFFLTDIDSTGIKQFFDYLATHKIKAAVIEIHSPGGALFDAQRIVNIMQTWQSRGGTVETRLYGAAFSAGFYIFVSGDVRLVSPYADLMWHEIQSYEGLGMKILTPSDQEEKTRVLRHLQDVRHTYLATRGSLTKEEIDKRVSKKEWWMSGADAVALKYADGFIK
ncbi:MAG: ATP-dependent Clp protease proteolytic subunit [Proteobacteria bacterium]|nr:ATP-dependent Clp protease proteolytic subunit [Pseudomonadota bacterium]